MNMDKLHYMAIIERGPDGSYGASFPDLPGCVAAADNELDVIRDAEIALEMHIQGMIEDGDILPLPSPPSTIEADPDVAEVARVMIGSAIDAPKVRVNVMLEPGVLKAIDLVTDNRSQFLSRAAKAMLRQSGAPAR